MTKRIEIHSGPDRLGRYMYTMFWPDNYFPGHPDGEYIERERAQVFHTTLPDWYKKEKGVRDGKDD